MQVLILSFLFITLYGSGFVATQLGLAYVDPMLFLILRFALTASLLLLICLVFKFKFTRSLKEFLHQCIAGALIVGAFSTGVFISIDLGTSAATSSLIISLQPLLASFLAYFLMGAAVTRTQLVGLVVGFTGVSLIVFNKLGVGSLASVLMSVFGLLGLTLGTLYHKKFCSSLNIFTAGLIQNIGAFTFCCLVAMLYGKRYIEWHSSFIFSLLWMAIAVSIGALSLLYVLIRELEISKVSSLFYLVPVSSALISLAVFNTQVSNLELIGVLVTSLAVSLINIKFKQPNSPKQSV